MKPTRKAFRKYWIPLRGDPYSTYDRRGGGGVVQISMKAYLGGRGSAISVHTFLKPKKGPVAMLGCK